jgi:hypothetical protein
VIEGTPPEKKMVCFGGGNFINRDYKLEKLSLVPVSINMDPCRSKTKHDTKVELRTKSIAVAKSLQEWSQIRKSDFGWSVSEDVFCASKTEDGRTYTRAALFVSARRLQ